MNNCFTGSVLTAVICAGFMATPASAQMHRSRAVSQVAGVPRAELSGIVLDEQGKPLAGAVASALGSTTAYAVSDADGRFLFRTLPYGPYLLRVHLLPFVAEHLMAPGDMQRG